MTSRGASCFTMMMCVAGDAKLLNQTPPLAWLLRDQSRARESLVGSLAVNPAFATTHPLRVAPIAPVCSLQVHTFDYVTMAIVKVVKTITRKKAHRITVQCHAAGTATVTTTWKAMAKTMCLKLQKFGLTSSIAPDS